MRTLLLIAPRDLGRIPKGFIIQVITSSTGTPSPKEVEEAIVRAGFTDTWSRSFRSSGNWTIKTL